MKLFFWRKKRDEKSAKARPAESEEHGQRPKPRRILHLGVDYGTNWSKLVFRDYEARGGERSVVIRLRGEDGGSGDYRVPSTVALHKERLWFGWHADRFGAARGASRFQSVKVLMAFPNDYHQQSNPIPEPLTAQDLAALTVLYLLQRGWNAVARYAKDLGVHPRLSMTLGVPMSQLDNVELRDVFVEVARTAMELFRKGVPDLSKGMSVNSAAELLAEGAEAVRQKAPATPEDWVRSEAASALLWAFRSPAVRGGLYAAVDVGAGSTSASWFRITEAGSVKKGMAFFGASCHPPGADAVEEAIAKAAGVIDLTAVRGKANEYLEELKQRQVPGLSDICDRIFSVYQQAFGRAYPKDKKQSHWYGASLFLLGGGTRIQPVRDRLRKRAWGQLDREPPIMDPGSPDDLFEQDGEPFQDDPSFLLVAYGLSHFAADVPDVTNPSDIPDFTPMLNIRPRIDPDDWYTE